MMHRWIRWFAVLLAALLLASPVLGVLPQQIKSARLTDATPARNIDNEVGNLEKALADILGLPLDTDITAAPFSITAAGIVTIAQNSLAAAGTTLTINDNLTVANNLVVSGAGPHAIGGVISAQSQLLLLGSFSPTIGGSAFRVDTTINAAAGESITAIELNPTVVEAASGTHGFIAGLNVEAINITPGAAATTNAASVRIAGAPTGATNNFALWSVSGENRFGGRVTLPDGSAGAPALASASSLTAGIYFPTANSIMFSTASTERMRLTDGGILALGTAVTTGAAAGDLVLANGGEALRFVNVAGTGTLAALAANPSDQIVLGPSAHVVPAGTADTVALLAATQTLTNKTLTAPALSGTATGTYTLGGTPTIVGYTTTGTATSTKACAAAFTRVGPNYCRWDGNGATQALIYATWTDATACTARTTDPAGGFGLPTDAKLALLEIRWKALSNNAIALRAQTTTFYQNTTCTAGNEVAGLRYSAREEVAVVAGTVIGEGTNHVAVPVPGASRQFYTTQDSAGGNGSAEIDVYTIVGYFD